MPHIRTALNRAVIFGHPIFWAIGFVALAVLIVAALQPTAEAATQGTQGATSTGSINISVTVGLRAKLTGLTDIALSNIDPAVASSNAQNVCAWTNSSTGYKITATGSGAASAFLISPTGGAAPSTVPYAVQWNQASGQTSGTALTAGTASSIFTNNAANPTCGGGTSASLIVNMASVDLLTMTAGTAYTGTLTLLMTPQ